MLSRFNTNPGRAHWTAAKRVLRYLKANKEHGVIFRRGGGRHSHKIRGFADADWAGDKDTRKSTSGFIFYLAEGPIQWVSVTQKSVSTSTHEAETIASSTASQEGIYLNRLWMEMNINQKFSPVDLGIDNQTSFEASLNPTTTGRAKHIDIRIHRIRQDMETALTNPYKVAGVDNDADMLTKALPKAVFEKHTTVAF